MDGCIEGNLDIFAAFLKSLLHSCELFHAYMCFKHQQRLNGLLKHEKRSSTFFVYLSDTLCPPCFFSQQQLNASRNPDPQIRRSRRRYGSCVSTPPTFTPIVVNLRLTHTLPDFQELERLTEDGTAARFFSEKEKLLRVAHGSTLFSRGISRSCDGLRRWK